MSNSVNLAPTPSASPQLDGTATELRPRTRPLRPVTLELEGGRRIPVPSESPLIVGHARNSGLYLDDPYVSTRHASIRIARTGVVVQDLGSKNGTRVDDVIIERAWARPGATLRFGRTRMRVVCGRAASAPVEEHREAQLIGQSLPFRLLLRTLERAARVRSPVLLRGETGTGKEMAARVIHRASDRRHQPFVPINCGAIPEALAESELFGHVRGAFTGAHRDHQGAFGRANGGTLLLDEVAELPPVIQAKLLRVLETGRVLPVGAEHEYPVDVRIIAATHRDLEAMVAKAALREDLYHRLGVLMIRLPALRERRDDIPLLLNHFARQASHDLGHPLELTAAAQRAATIHSWPGNIRALRNAVIRAGTLTDGPIGPHTLIPTVPPATGPVPPGCILIPRGSYDSMRTVLLRRIVEEEGSIRRAARVLGVARSTLGNWLREAAP